MSQAFRSLKVFNFRIWTAGSLVSHIGGWMQRIGQDWLVLTILTDNNATAVGIVTALQFGPQIVLLPLTGYVCDHFDRRRVVLVVETILAILAFTLGALTICGVVELWHVYGLALALGCATAFEAPARTTFCSELVSQHDLPNAVALSSTIFNAARLIGPAVAGALIAATGVGWAFIINGVSFAAVVIAIFLMRADEIRKHQRSAKGAPGSGLIDGFRYVWRRADLKVLLFMLFLVGTFGLNFPIFISTMSVSVFHLGAREFGLLTSAMAIGSVAGALFAAGRMGPRIETIGAGGLVFAAGCAMAALMPSYWLFGACLAVIGAAAQTFVTSLNSLVQMSTDAAMRGRVVAILLALTMGGTSIGGPMVGLVADRAGPRWALGVGAVSGLAAALVAALYLARRDRPDSPIDAP